MVCELCLSKADPAPPSPPHMAISRGVAVRAVSSEVWYYPVEAVILI